MNEFLEFDLSEKQINQLNIYYDFLIKQNEVQNLTAITERKEVFIKHFLDSLELSKVVDLEHKSLIDVGSGAGFPSIPLKILIPSLEVTIVDSLGKRINFLKDLTKNLEIDVKLVHARAEDYVSEVECSFDFATARAVARLNVLIELCFSFVKVGGKFLCMKSIQTSEEIEEAKNAFKVLNAKLVKVHEYYLPENMGERSVIVIEKLKHNSKYPRHFSKIKKNPL